MSLSQYDQRLKAISFEASDLRQELAHLRTLAGGIAEVPQVDRVRGSWAYIMGYLCGFSDSSANTVAHAIGHEEYRMGEQDGFSDRMEMRGY